MDPCSACIFGNNNPLAELAALPLIWLHTPPEVAVSLDVVDVIDLVLPFVCLRLCFERGDGEFDATGAVASSPVVPILCRLAVKLLRKFDGAVDDDDDCCSTMRMDF